MAWPGLDHRSVWMGIAAIAVGCAVAPQLPDPADAQETRLTIEVRRAPEAQPERYTLTCDPPGGTLPDARGACERLTAAAAAFAPVPPVAVCTQIYGGPEEAAVNGVHRGRGSTPGSIAGTAARSRATPR